MENIQQIKTCFCKPNEIKMNKLMPKKTTKAWYFSVQTSRLHMYNPCSVWYWSVQCYISTVTCMSAEIITFNGSYYRKLVLCFQDKNTKPEKQNKRPSRKHRRRPKNLLAEYTRRQRKHVWLETHIWHAKRFHMIEKWGCKIPWKPTEKNVRACYRASTQHCLIQVNMLWCQVNIVWFK